MAPDPESTPWEGALKIVKERVEFSGSLAPSTILLLSFLLTETDADEAVGLPLTVIEVRVDADPKVLACYDKDVETWILNLMGIRVNLKGGTFVIFFYVLFLGGCVAAVKRPVSKSSGTLVEENRAPDLASQILYFDGDGDRLIELNGSDKDGDPITYEIISPPDPAKGSLNSDQLANGKILRTPTYALG